MAEKKRSVLVIDDDPSILRTLRRVLDKSGYEVDTARSGSESVERLAARSYDAAIVDAGLGDMKGTDLLPRMRKLAPNMVRIMLTGTPMTESLLEKAMAEANVFLLKPVKPEVILQILEENIPRL
jgi:DNA-binding response OmpR family regulator